MVIVQKNSRILKKNLPYKTSTKKHTERERGERDHVTGSELETLICGMRMLVKSSGLIIYKYLYV